jgi:LysM repeat protein
VGITGIFVPAQWVALDKQRRNMRKIALVLLFAAAGTGVATGSAHAADGKADQPHKRTVVSGDNLSSIATESNLESWRPIWNANTDLQNPDQINPGQELIIRGSGQQTTDRPLPAGYGEPVVTPVTPSAAVVAAPLVRYQPTVKRSFGAAGGDLASRVRARESGGNYGANTGNGYYGAYQFDVGTWGGYGGYARADLAPAAIQDAKFQETYGRRGCSPWPNTCF